MSALDIDFYRSAYPELRYYSDEAIERHWEEVGLPLGRVCSEIDFWRRLPETGSRAFDVGVYRAFNPELREEFGHDSAAFASHFLHFWPVEKRPHCADISWLIEILDERGLVRSPQSHYVPSLSIGPLDHDLSAYSRIDLLRVLIELFEQRQPRGGEIDRFLRCTSSSMVGISEAISELIGIRFLWSCRVGHPVGVNSSMWIRPDVPKGLVDPDRAIPIHGGTSLTLKQWTSTVNSVLSRPQVEEDSSNLQPVVSELEYPDPPRASVLVSLFRSETYLQSFLSNLAEQSVFGDLEIGVVCVDPSEFESSVLMDFSHSHSNVVLDLVPERLGIYASWNRAIAMTRAPLVTNANVDDLRRSDSFEIQIEMMEKYPWVDVVYQDVVVSLDRSLPFRVSEAAGFVVEFPAANRGAFLNGVNPPHNGPMWRRALHDSVGYFDESFTSAGDFDFWHRVLLAGGVFIGCSDPHVEYFLNPDGLSTGNGSSVTREIETIHERYFRRMVESAIPRNWKDWAYLSPRERRILALIEEVEALQ